MPSIDTPRARLRKLLGQQLTGQPLGQYDRTVLKQAIEALIVLEYGEVQPPFVPRKKKGEKYGSKPYTLRRFRMRALGFADLFIKNKYKGDQPALATVALAYKVSPAAFDGWRKTLGKTTDPRMRSFRKEIASLPWEKSAILSALEADGELYQREVKLAFQQN
jgi:hypothetical protein